MAGTRTLTGRVAIVTGASSGIGEAGARALARAGATVVLAARRVERLEQIADRINRAGVGRAIAAPGDVTCEADRLTLVERAGQATGHVDVLVNNAGFGVPGAVEELPLDSFREQLETNLFAAVHLMQLVIPSMRAHRDGRIVNMSSLNGRLVTPGLAAYAASKFALEAVSDAARIELRPFGVHVSLIEPGMIKTEIWGVGRARGEQLLREPSPYAALYRALEHMGERAERSGADPRVVAPAIVHAAASPRPRARYVMPLDSRLASAFGHLPAFVRDPLVGRAFAMLGR